MGALCAIMATMTMTKRRSRTQTTPETNPRHPLAMPATVSIEMWERFSFYGMQAILAYYLYYATTDGGLGLERAQATTLLGAYGASVYLCTLAGGWIGDRLIGTERTLLTGCIALMVGHLSLSTLSGGAGATFGLALIAIGSGFVKTAAITILGHAYPTDDPRRDAGFQLFYLGINIGAVLGPLLTGWLSTKYTFHTGFLAAAGLMGIGLITYLALRRRYLTALSSDTATALTAPTNPIPFGRAAITISIVIAGIVGVCWCALGQFHWQAWPPFSLSSRSAPQWCCTFQCFAHSRLLQLNGVNCYDTSPFLSHRARSGPYSTKPTAYLPCTPIFALIAPSGHSPFLPPGRSRSIRCTSWRCPCPSRGRGQKLVIVRRARQ